MSNVPEMLEYLQRQIDPHDRMNPKYAALHKQIDAIIKAQSLILAAQLAPMLLVFREWQLSLIQ